VFIGTRLTLALAAVLASASAWAQPAQSDICTPGYAREHRMSRTESSRIKRSLLPPGVAMRDVVLDHRIPLEIGGGNDRSNLMLQSPAESRRKDRLENFARRAVCAGSVSLDEARGWFADWKASYRRAFRAEP
jgi:hypothetical protein